MKNLKFSTSPTIDGWLFILGVNNSGTTLLARILATHPLIYDLPDEGQLLTEALPRPDYENVVRLWTKKLSKFRLTDANDCGPAKAARIDWLNYYPELPGLRLEKSPPNTIRSLWLQKCFSQSIFIALTRHPYAVCEGIRRRMGCTLGEAALHWKTANEILLKDIPHLKKVLLIKYETLISCPAKTLNEIAHLCSIDNVFDLEKIANIKSHSIDGQSYGLTDMNQKSINNLTTNDILLINDICGSAMRELGYKYINPHG